MRVIHILQSSHFSGAENVVCQIIKMFTDDKRFEMVYVSRGGKVEPVLEQMKIPYYRLEKFNIASIRKAIDDLKPDIVHAHDISASVLCALASVGKKCQVISHVHVNNSNMSKFNYKTFLYRIACVKFKHIFWVSDSCFNGFVYKNAISDKSDVLYNVMSRQSVIEKKEFDTGLYNFDICYVGRITSQKDPDKLVRVLKKTVELKSDIKIAIVGTGDLEEHTKQIVSDNNLDDNIIFFGFMKNPLRVLEGSKVMVMTSKYEGLPMTVLEAMALGVPIVSTPVDGLKTVVFNDKNGYLEADEDSLARRLIDIVNSTELRKRLSEGSSTIFDELNNIEKYKKKLIEIYT